MNNCLSSHVFFNNFSVLFDLSVESLVFLIKHLEFHLLLLSVGQMLCFGFLKVERVSLVFPFDLVGMLRLLSIKFCSFSGQIFLELDVLCLDGHIRLLMFDLSFSKVSINCLLRASNFFLLLVDDDNLGFAIQNSFARMHEALRLDVQNQLASILAALTSQFKGMLSFVIHQLLDRVAHFADEIVFGQVVFIEKLEV